jgi:putative ABC transport system permease protein
MTWLADLVHDLRVGGRTMLRQRAFTALAVATLALGIGANTALYAVMNALLLRPLAYPDSEQLVRVYRTIPESPLAAHSMPAFFWLQAHNQSFEQLAVFAAKDLNFAEAGRGAERLRGIVASAELWPALRVAPALGRMFGAEDHQPGNENVVVLSHRLWRTHFGGDPGLVGRRLRIDGTMVTVVGVMAPFVDQPAVWGRVDLWQPFAFKPEDRAPAGRWNRWLEMAGRLKPGVSLAAAQAELHALAGRVAGEYPIEVGSGLRAVPLRTSGTDETLQRLSWLTLGLAGFVLLIVCANLAGVLVAKLAARGPELVTRSALGAGRGRLVRQLLAESLLVTVAGGVLSWPVMQMVAEFLIRRLRVGGELGAALAIDWRVLAFALAATLGTGLAFGVAPAWLGARRGTAELRVRGAAGGQHRLRQALVVCQVALALVLLAGASVFVHGLYRFTHRDPGWQVDGLHTAELSLWGPKYGVWGVPEQRRAFVERLREKLAAAPGIERAAVSISLPTDGFPDWVSLVREGAAPLPPGREPLAVAETVTPGYFETLGVRLLEGRAFSELDGPNSPRVAVIGQALARRLFPEGSALGKRIGSPDGRSWRQIVGVVSDVGLPGSLDRPTSPFQLYRSLAQEPSDWITILLRGPSAEGLATSLRRAVSELDPDLPVTLVPARTLVDRALANFALIGWVLLGFAGLGLLLAALGIYGTFSVFVVQRTGEIGVRVALGAQTTDILWMVLGRGLRLATIGVALGLVGALALARVLGSLLAELPAPHPPALVAVAASLLAVALLACWLPARRAAALDPANALRRE